MHRKRLTMDACAENLAGFKTRVSGVHRAVFARRRPDYGRAREDGERGEAAIVPQTRDYGVPGKSFSMGSRSTAMKFSVAKLHGCRESCRPSGKRRRDLFVY